QDAAAAMPAPSALEILSSMFGLSAFERDLLLMCAGVELDSTFAALCARAQSDPSRPFPTFSLALAALPEAHWSSMSPTAPLRRWRLIEVGSGMLLTVSALRIDERILNYLTGVQHIDERLAGLIHHLNETGHLTASHEAVARRIVSHWNQSAQGGGLPVVQLCGTDAADQRAIAVAACAAIGLHLGSIPASALPVGASEVDGFMRLWGREAVLSNSALLLECHELEANDTARTASINRLIEGLNSPLIISTVERRHASHVSMVTLDVDKPSAAEQREIWKRALNGIPGDLNNQVHALVSQFNLSAQKVYSARMDALGRDGSNGSDLKDPVEFGNALWDACRMQARPRLDNLAQRIEPAATWNELVLPGARLETLRDIAMHVRHRMTVYETWGFATKDGRGLGISALFSGVSGTGKTMAAEVLANELRLDLYRIDLSAVVSKYIGETEKNLRRVFDAAEEGGAILLFDEADALFGKRSEVKDSHDRYANIEVSYLLQRMEMYRGLAILTSNLKSALDSAFLRRIRFIIHFPFPDSEHRAEIWRRIFPRQTPTEDLNIDRLARLNVAGGNIRSIALNAAFLAADADEPVRMTHLLRAARSEYTKLEKSLTDAEVGGWV
ncbi:MAG TPA: ATP-binding protein, partial [Pyrinomonadaceae bacterium]